MAEQKNAPAPAATVHQVAQFVGHVGTKRVITKKDQDKLIGVPGVAKEDLVWEAGNRKVNVTDVHEDVLSYLKDSDEFKVRSVEAPAAPAKA
jgi:hypothetical protein